MLEQGLVALIQSGTSNLAPGGFAVQLPPNQISVTATQAYTYEVIMSEPSYVLEGQDGFTSAIVRINCHGLTAATAQALARAVDGVLRGGYAGTLTDPDATIVYGIFRMGSFVDGYSDANRSFVRTLEYRVNFGQV